MGLYFIKLFEVIWEHKLLLFGPFAFVLWFTDIASKLVFEAFWGVLDMVAEIDPNSLETANFATLDYIGIGNAILPISEMLAATVIYYTLWTALIALRWIKSFIPTLAN